MPGIVLIKMAENGDVTIFTPTAKTEGTWLIFFLSSLVLYPNSKEHGNTNQAPRIRQGSRFLLRQCATWEFRPPVARRADPELKGGRSSSLQAGVFFASTTKKEAGFVLLVSPTPRMAKSRLWYWPGTRSSKNHV